MHDLFDGLTPGLGPFADIVKGWVSIFIAPLWVCVVVFCVIHLIIGVWAVVVARRTHRAVGEGVFWRIVWSLGGLVVLGFVALIWLAAITPAAREKEAQPGVVQTVAVQDQ